MSNRDIDFEQEGRLEQDFVASVGRIMEQKRRQRGMTQTDLGNMIGVHRNTICRWEGGSEELPLWGFLRLCDVLAISPLRMLPPRELHLSVVLKMRQDWANEEKARVLMAKMVQSERDPALTRVERGMYA